MRILLWVSSFFGCDIQIKNVFVSMEYKVDLIKDRTFKSSFTRAISKREPILISYILMLYSKKKLKTITHDFENILAKHSLDGWSREVFGFES